MEKAVGSGGPLESAPPSALEWLEDIANGETAICVSGGKAATEVVVLKYFFTLQGLNYHLKHEKPEVRWTVAGQFIQPMNGMTQNLAL